jgi:hypothetical protein
MTIFSRSTLKEAFPKNERAVREFEKLDRALSDVDDNGKTISERVADLEAAVGSGAYQPAHKLLDAISNLEPGKIGAIEVKEDGTAIIREIDALDPASLITRGVGYTVFMGLGGKGTTAQRPTVPVNTISIYLDTTLDPDGQPIIWNGSYWVNFSGAPV